MTLLATLSGSLLRMWQFLLRHSLTKAALLVLLDLSGQSHCGHGAL